MQFVLSNGVASAMPGAAHQMTYNQTGYAVNSQETLPQFLGESPSQNNDVPVTTTTCGTQSFSSRLPLLDPSCIQHGCVFSKTAWQERPSDHVLAGEECTAIQCSANVTHAIEDSGHKQQSNLTDSRKTRRRGSARKSLNAKLTAGNSEKDEFEAAADVITNEAFSSSDVIDSLPMEAVAIPKYECNNPSLDAPRPMKHNEQATTSNVLDNVHTRNEMQLVKNSPREECVSHDIEIKTMAHALEVEAYHEHEVCERDDAITADNSRSLQTTPIKMHPGTHSRRKSSRGSRNAQKLMSFQDPGVTCSGSDNNMVPDESKQNAD
jgi:hypothetical protein